MADFDVQGARKAGYTDAEIADHLAQQSGFDVSGARKAGYSDQDVISHLAGAGGSAGTDETAQAVADRRAMPKPLRMIDAAGRGAADMLSLGFGDELSAGAQALPSLFTGGTDGFGKAFDRYVGRERAIDAADKADVPVSRDVGEGAGFLGGLGAGAVADVGRFVPQFFRAGIPRMAENVLKSAGAGALYGGGASAGNATGDVPQRLEAAVPGAIVGAGLGAAAVPVTELAGAGLNALRMRNASPLSRAANALSGRFDVPAAQAQADALRAAGAVPTAVSAMDESGRGYVRAAASRQTPGREIVQQRAEGAALNLPDRIGMQARAHLSSDPRTPMQIGEDLSAARGTAADANFGAVRGDTIPMAPETVQALRNPMGKDAIAEAARRERDPEIRAALNRLATDALDDPSTPITVGMADRISRTLYGRGQAAAASGDRDLAATYTSLGDAVRGPTRAASTGYDAALGDYAAQSQIMGAADKGEDFLKRNTDEFVAEAPGPGQPGNDLARATARRAVERAAGENVSAAPGVARKLAYAPEQQARNAALLGPEDAQRMQTSMAAEARTVRDLGDVAPRSGSQTQLRGQDAEQASAAVDLAHAIMTGGKSVVSGLLNRLKTAGISDADAHAVADIATDPNQLDALLSRMDQMRPGYGAAMRSIIRQSVVKDAGEMSQPAAMMTDAQGNVYDYSGKIIGHAPTPAPDRNALK